MNFKNVILALVDYFESQQIEYALAGAFALKAYGYVRATQDIDFVVRQESQYAIIQFLESLGFETLYRSKGYSNHRHPLSGLGQIDFIYVSGETATAVFSEAQERSILREVRLPVVTPVHLVAMKVFAMKNDPRRRFREMADIEFLTSLPEVRIEEVKIYFEKHGLLEDFEQITQRKKVNDDS